MFFRLITTLALMSIAGVVSAAPKSIPSKPLAEVVRTSVGKVRTGTIQLPVITWGADIRTIYANGNSATTSGGSIFAKQGLKFKIVREDVFSKQLQSYISGKSPYLRGTLGMVNMASELLNKDSRTKPIVIYQLSESAGGDALVVKSGIKSAKDLKGKTIAVQAYGPHVDYLTKVLADAGLKIRDVTIKWYPDLTGTDNTPMAAMYTSGVDAAMVIIPDALALTSGGNVGTGSEDSVKGARILLSTKTANRVIADVYAVRSDYFKAHKKDVEKFVRGLMQARDDVKALVKNKNAASYKETMRASAKLLLDSEQAISDTEGLYADANHVSSKANQKFFTNNNYPRNFQRRNGEIQAAFISMGLLKGKQNLSHAKWNYNSLAKGQGSSQAEAPQFNSSQVATVVARKQQQGTLSEGELFSFEVFFKPNQKQFSVDLYQKAFDKVVDLASTYGGAIITVEGHSDPLGYLRKKKKRESDIVLRRVKQSAKNLSVTRASAVRDNIIQYAKQKQIALDKSQFAVVGHGISRPKNGMCGGDPCAPKNEKEWRNNMRVEFRIIQVEAEADVFRPL